VSPASCMGARSGRRRNASPGDRPAPAAYCTRIVTRIVAAQFLPAPCVAPASMLTRSWTATGKRPKPGADSRHPSPRGPEWDSWEGTPAIDARLLGIQPEALRRSTTQKLLTSVTHGSWSSTPLNARVARRNRDEPSNHGSNLGFRRARSLPPGS